MQSTANDLLIVRVPRKIARRHQRTNDVRSVAVAGLRLRRTASLQSVPVMLRFGLIRGVARAILYKISRHLPSMMCVLGLCSQQQPLCLYSVFRAILCVAISTPTTRSLSWRRWPQAQAHRELAIGARNATVWTFLRRGPHNFVQSIAPSTTNYVRPRFMQSTATALLILHVLRNIARRHQRTNDVRSVAVAGLRLKRTVSLQSAPAMLRF